MIFLTINLNGRIKVLTEPRKALQFKGTQWFPRIGPRLIAWTTKCPIWVPLSCRALLGSVNLTKNQKRSIFFYESFFLFYSLVINTALFGLKRKYRKYMKTFMYSMHSLALREIHWLFCFIYNWHNFSFYHLRQNVFSTLLLLRK